MPADSFSQALSELDPASRALLDLSLRRGMRPEEIGELLGTDPESVIVARENALEQLTELLGMDDVSELDGVRARLAELPSDVWTPPAPSDPVDAPAAEESERPALEPATPEAEHSAESAESAAPAESVAPARKRRLPLLLALLAVAAVALVAVLATSGGGSDTSSPPANAPAAQKHSKPPNAPPSRTPSTGPKVKLAPVAGSAGGVAATASLAAGGKRLLLDVKGLPDPGSGSYQVWLFDSVVDARSIGSARGRDLRMDLRLPAQASRYRSIDVSFEPSDGNPNHSGQSVLRVPLSKLSP